MLWESSWRRRSTHLVSFLIADFSGDAVIRLSHDETLPRAAQTETRLSECSWAAARMSGS
jgi:hypothetical protein